MGIVKRRPDEAARESGDMAVALFDLLSSMTLQAVLLEMLSPPRLVLQKNPDRHKQSCLRQRPWFQRSYVMKAGVPLDE